VRWSYAALLLGAIACGDDAGPSDANDPTTYECQSERCALGTEACVWPAFGAAHCEPQLSPEKMGLERCRDHIDAYCGGTPDRCVEGGGDASRPTGVYDVFCG
jgi:hypothetical protein